MQIRTGQGIDVHQFAADRPLRIGGLSIPHSQGLAGHSDADVLLHAIVDALLGAVAGGDIGALFPDNDPAYKDKDSTFFVHEVMQRLRQDGWQLVNLDSTLIAEQPKFRPHIDAIRQSLAELLEISVSAISVKATTAEKMGALGRQEGICAMAVVLVQKES